MYDLFEGAISYVGSGDDGEVYANKDIAVKLFLPGSDTSEMNIATLIKTVGLSAFDPEIIMIGKIDGIPALVRENLNDIEPHHEDICERFFRYSRQRREIRRNQDKFLTRSALNFGDIKKIISNYAKSEAEKYDNKMRDFIPANLEENLEYAYYQYEKEGIGLEDMYCENFGLSRTGHLKFRDLSKCDIMTQLPDYPDHDITDYILDMINRYEDRESNREKGLEI